jgi:hypothetical protein
VAVSRVVFTTLDIATSAKGFDGKAAAVDSVIGMYEGAAGGGLGKLGAVATPWMTKSAGPVLGFMGDVALHSIGSAGIGAIDPLYRNLANGKPIDPEVLLSRALASGIMAGCIRTGLKLPMGKPPANLSDNQLSLDSKPLYYYGSNNPAIKAPLADSYEWALSAIMRAITLIAFPKR